MVQGAVDGSVLETALRTIFIYGFTLALVRFGSARVMGKGTVMDTVVAIMLGSIMSDGIEEGASLAPILAAGTVLMGMHWILAFVAFHTDWLGPLVKGDRVLLVRDGTVQEDGMRKGNVTRHDLMQAIRERTKHTDPSRVRLAYLERDGQISVVPENKKSQILDIAVEDGVQTVRIELE